MKQWVVYILRSESTSQFCVGSTGDLAQRIDYHNRGLTRWTRGKGPWVCVYQEPFATHGDALRRERQLKSWESRAALEALIRQTSGNDGV